MSYHRNIRIISFIATGIFLLKLVDTIRISDRFRQEFVEPNSYPEAYYFFYGLFFWLVVCSLLVLPFLLIKHPKNLAYLLILCLAMLVLYALDFLPVMSLILW